MLVVDEKTMDRFWAKVQAEPNSGCWLWEASVTNDGYGNFYVPGKPMTAHRFSYEVHRGLVPPGLEIDHLCRIRNCVNPDHLEAITHLENIRRGTPGRYNLYKTHCPQGHPYRGDNLYSGFNGDRRCRICSRVNARRGNARAKLKREAEQGYVSRANRTKTHCPYGHSYSGDNLYVDLRGKRCCRECSRRRLREHRARQKAIALAALSP